MNAQTKIEAPAADKPTGLALLRIPFPDSQVSKLPKETKTQREARERDKSLMVFNCASCGGHHHKQAVHLDYVGHAALTNRLLDADPNWNWEPVALTDAGLPALDQNGGLWIKLTVCGQTRLGYGNAEGKCGGDAIKEIIGDALRNAAMRFGAALDLWHKGDLHADSDAGDEHRQDESTGMPDAEWAKLVQMAKAAGVSSDFLCRHYKVRNLRTLTQDQYADAIQRLTDEIAAKAKAETDAKAAQQTSQQNGAGFGIDDEIGF